GGVAEGGDRGHAGDDARKGFHHWNLVVVLNWNVSVRSYGCFLMIWARSKRSGPMGDFQYTVRPAVARRASSSRMFGSGRPVSGSAFSRGSRMPTVPASPNRAVWMPYCSGRKLGKFNSMVVWA